MNDRYRQAKRYWAQHSLFNRKLSYKMLIWSMRRRRDKAEVVLDVSEEFPRLVIRQRNSDG